MSISKNRYKPDITECWGASSLNSERTGNRNESHIDFVFDNVTGIDGFEMTYQFCGHSNIDKKCKEHKKRKFDSLFLCRVITAIIISTPQSKFRVEDVRRAQMIGKMLKVPVLAVQHEAYDYNHDNTIDYQIFYPDEKPEFHEEKLWREDFLMSLISSQCDHEDDGHNCVISSPPKNKSPFFDGEWDAKINSEFPRKRSGVDLTISKIIRLIPGVRHLDVDGFILCDTCDEVLILIEASSDGRGKQVAKDKPITMTLNLANKLGARTMRIIHEVTSKVDSTSDCDLRVWNNGANKNDIAVDKVSVTMNDVIGTVQKIVDEHRTKTRH